MLMRAIVAWCVCWFLVCAGLMVDTFLPGGPVAPPWLSFVPFPALVPAFITVMFTLNGRVFGRMPWRVMWDALRPLPVLVKGALAVLFAAALVNFAVMMATTPTGHHDDGPGLSFQRGYVGNGAWLFAVTAALAYGILLRRRAADAAR
ncbi:hypothetical protein R8Z50_16830 [Longispora sp. K20-0274]|uniref:hypothetical protein n=1 Tax=Longispora sp. K20-0274 TaxID=3088255 RepID=UPI003999C17D